MNFKFCPHCGSKAASAVAKFCAGCGESLDSFEKKTVAKSRRSEEYNEEDGTDVTELPDLDKVKQSLASVNSSASTQEFQADNGKRIGSSNSFILGPNGPEPYVFKRREN